MGGKARSEMGGMDAAGCVHGCEAAVVSKYGGTPLDFDKLKNRQDAGF